MVRKWTGEYTYGEEFIQVAPKKPTRFVIEFTEENGTIKGSCIDEDTKEVFDKPATIDGYMEGGIINFVKTYPCYCEWDVESNKPRVFEDIPSQNIQYVGWLVDDQHYEGDWEYSVTYIHPNGSEEEFTCRGKWKLLIK